MRYFHYPKVNDACPLAVHVTGALFPLPRFSPWSSEELRPQGLTRPLATMLLLAGGECPARALWVLLSLVALPSPPWLPLREPLPTPHIPTSLLGLPGCPQAPHTAHIRAPPSPFSSDTLSSASRRLNQNPRDPSGATAPPASTSSWSLNPVGDKSKPT